MQLRWLLPGMHVKRWLLLLAVSFAALGLGTAVVLQDLYQYQHFRWPSFVGFLALRWLPHYHSVKALLLFALGVGGAAYAVYKLNTSLLSAVVADKAKLVDLVYRHRLGHRGPRVVAIGGGHGLAILLCGLKRHTDNLTAIVTVADDCGSSTTLRRWTTSSCAPNMRKRIPRPCARCWTPTSSSWARAASTPACCRTCSSKASRRPSTPAARSRCTSATWLPS